MSTGWVIHLAAALKLHGTYPITESKTVMSRPTTQIENKTKDDEANDGHYFDGREPELAFTKCAGAQEVDDDDDDTSYGNPDRVVDIIVPICGRSSAS